ncbi:MAG TPA: hypothetical protein VEO95_08315, partial [Chthoniobacteraceae bacterium]|nr:hypothetical protein [Chthoniobacteraceae bacterium]
MLNIRRRIRQKWRLHLCGAVFAVLFALAGARARAATLIWSGLGGDSNISTAANWLPLQAPAAGDALVFGGGTRLAPQLTANLSVGSITFNATAGAFVVGGSATFSIDSGGITNSDAGAQTINAAIKLTADQTWNAAAGDLAIGGAIDKNNQALTIDGSFNTALSGAVSG